MGGDWGTAIAFGVVASLAGFFSLIGLALGLVAFATSFAWHRWPRLDEYYAVGSIICLVCYVTIWVTWQRMPTDWQRLLAATVGPTIGVLSAWRSHRRRSGTLG